MKFFRRLTAAAAAAGLFFSCAASASAMSFFYGKTPLEYRMGALEEMIEEIRENYKDETELDDIFAVAAERGEEPFVVVLDGITDPHNLGAIIRSAECAGAHGVVIPERRAAGLSPAAAKAAAGALNHMPIARVKNLNRALDDLKEAGLWVTGTAMDGESAYTADLTGPVALVIGSEGEGMSRLARERCDRVVSLPVKGHIDSLNASVAAGVLMYEIVRQRSR